MQNLHFWVSELSTLGVCETRFTEIIDGKAKVTAQMAVGKEMHEQLVAPLPKLTRKGILEKVKAGAEFSTRELPVTDNVLSLRGKIDQLDLHGTQGDKNIGTIVDDKYPKAVYRCIPLYYRLQLAAYAVAVQDSMDLGPLCSINDAKLICREAKTHKILNTLYVGHETLASWASNVPFAVSAARKLANKEKSPEHQRFDTATGSWVNCYCDLGV
ncbi:MAG: PD-(D/E)XK nuclease family protein [Candidatus Bathyarchaeia archaeon]